jgi:2Fe-2S ferredoxin
VFVDPSWIDRLPMPQSDEKELLVELANYDASRSRLSCQLEFTTALDGLAVEVAPDE